MKPSVLDRFLENIMPEPNSGCWLWMGSRFTFGHGRITRDGIRAHVFSYQHFIGPVASGLIVRHRCDNPPCVNPEHLLVGTHAENSQDMVDRDRQVSIVADPPWCYRNSKARKSGASLQYPVMPVEDIAALDVVRHSFFDAHLWLWTTNLFMEQAHWVLRSWGFEPVTILTWCKVAVFRDGEAGSTAAITDSDWTTTKSVPVTPGECLIAPWRFHCRWVGVSSDPPRFLFAGAATWAEAIRSDITSGERRLVFPVEQVGHNGKPHILWADVEP